MQVQYLEDERHCGAICFYAQLFAWLMRLSQFVKDIVKKKGRIKPAAADKASQNRSRLLFHGLIRLRLRNSGFALKQSRRGRLISPHEMSQTLATFCFPLTGGSGFLCLTSSKLHRIWQRNVLQYKGAELFPVLCAAGL